MSHRHYSIRDTDIEKLNVHLLYVSLSKYEKDWSSLLHTHEFTELFFVANGSGSFRFRDESRPIKTGDLVIIPPYLEHTEQSSPEDPLEYYSLGIGGVTFLPEDQQKGPQIFCNIEHRSFFAGLFDQMLYEIRNKKYGADKICQNFLEIVILRLIRAQHLVPVPIRSGHMSKECAQIKSYLDANYSKQITLDTLAEMTHMNKYYMAHSFTRYTGLSPIQYLNQRRLENACTLLKDTDHSISNIAVSTGFSSQSYFTQIFRKKYGVTPMKYRQTHSRKQDS